MNVYAPGLQLSRTAWVPGMLAPPAPQQGRPQASAKPRCDYIREEAAWRMVPPGTDGMVVGRWTQEGQSTVHEAKCANDCYTIEINLRSTAMDLAVDRRPIHNGRLVAGAVQLTPPGRKVVARFEEPVDFLHIFVPADQIIEIIDSPRFDPRPTQPPMFDAVVERLAWSLLKVPELEPLTARAYCNGLTAAIVARVASRELCPATSRHSGQPVGLLKWRLTRVMRFIEERLSDPIRLTDLASCAGLSRMHFAAQFRAATGMRPHDYIVRRRIERAQQLLRETSVPLVQVALSVGFQTQAHFTTVFRDIVAETPGQWRQLAQAA